MLTSDMQQMRGVIYIGKGNDQTRSCAKHKQTDFFLINQASSGLLFWTSYNAICIQSHIINLVALKK